MIELPVVMDGKKTEEQDEGKGNPGGERRAQWLSQSAEEKAACNRCDGIDVHVKDDGHAARHHIADDAASDSGDEPQHNGKDDVVARIAVERSERPCHGESGKADRIGQVVQDRDDPFPALRDAEKRIAEADDKRRHDRHDEPFRRTED